MNSPEELAARQQLKDVRERRKLYLSEYEAVMALMRDTGDSIWVINGAYLVAVSVLISAVAAGLGREDALSLLGSIGGLVICFLWFRSFKHNYRYYVLRIDYGRWLERQLGFLVLRMGALMGSDQPGAPPPQDANPFEYFNDRDTIKDAATKIEATRFKNSATTSIQRLTSWLIGVLATFFVVLATLAVMHMGAHHHRHHSCSRRPDYVLVEFNG